MALVSVKMPQLGESVVDGTVERWLKKEGESVARDEPLVEVVTDKVNAEVTSQFEGTLVRIEVAEGQTAAVGATIARMDVAGAEEEVLPGMVRTDAGESATPGEEAHPDPGALDQAGADSRLMLSPPVRRLAREHDVDLSSIPGTGAGGRITREDVLAHIARGGQAVGPAPVGSREELLHLSAARRQLADNLVKSVSTIPHAWGMREVDMSALVLYRAQHKEAFQQEHGVPLTYLPFVIQVVCDALQANPLLNSTWRDDGILVKHFVNLGVAVALPDSLIVPVIKDADQIGVVGLAKAIHDLTSRAREKKLRPADVQGGTFTLNNAGAFGGFAGMSIINYPQAAILTIQSIMRRPVNRNEQIVLRDMMNLNLSFDHRILDGLQAGQFLTAVQNGLERWTPAAIKE